MAAAPVALAIAGTAISAAGTAASIASQMNQGGGNGGAASTEASLKQLSYLEAQQQKKNALTTEMMETAKKFAAQQYDQDMLSLQQLRDVQAQELQQQRIIAEQAYIENERSVRDAGAENLINDSTTDFQKRLQLDQANLNRDLGDLQRTGQYRLKETGRKISDLNQDLALEGEQNKQDLDRLQNQAQFGITEAGADLSLMSEQQQLKQGREQAMLEYMRGQDQLGTDQKLLDISQAGAEQTTAYQKMSQDMQLYGQLLEVDTAREQGRKLASNDKKLAGQMSTSDYRANIDKSGIEGLMKAQDTATLNNYMMKGSLNNQLDINLSEIQAKRLGLQQKASELNTALRIDEIGRRQQGFALQAGRDLESLKNKVSMFLLPEAARQLSSMQAGQQVATNKMGTNLDRMNDQQQFTQQALLDEYGRGVDQTQYNIDQTGTQLGRVVRDSDLQQAGAKNNATYQQALYDLIYGQQSLDKNYQIGQQTAEAAKQNTMMARDQDQLLQIAAQRQALSSAMSGIQGIFQTPQGGGGGLQAALEGIGGLFNSGVRAYDQYNTARQLRPQPAQPASFSGSGGALPAWVTPQYNNAGYAGGNYSVGNGGYGLNGFVAPVSNIPGNAFVPNQGASLGTGRAAGGF